MLFDCYLAMTAYEMEKAKEIPAKVAWMACHFSPYGTGLSNLPTWLPPKSIIILNDRTPVCGHDPAVVAQQLKSLCYELDAEAVLLDFQRPFSEAYEAIVIHVARTLTVPVGVTEAYASIPSCSVFLPPTPLLCKPAEYYKKWIGRELWLEAAIESKLITITSEDVFISPTSHPETTNNHFQDKDLICHYQAKIADDHITFSLNRSYDDLKKIAELAKQLGVTKFIGLYQEIGNL